MLCSTTRPLFVKSPITHFTTHCRPQFRRITMSSDSSPSSSSTIEHIVLFNVKPNTDSTQLSSMINGLNSLTSLPVVLHLTAGKLHKNRSPNLSFTHMLHSRYNTKDDLANYSEHPDHLSVVRGSVLPICDDIMAVDWVAQKVNGSSNDGVKVKVKPGSAMRLQLVKLKEGVKESEKDEIFEVISGLKEKVSGIEEITYGMNFSPGRAKGFEICSIGVFSGVEELEAVEGNDEIEKEKDKVRDYIDDLVVVDYVVPASAQSAASL